MHWKEETRQKTIPPILFQKSIQNFWSMKKIQVCSAKHFVEKQVLLKMHCHLYSLLIHVWGSLIFQEMCYKSHCIQWDSFTVERRWASKLFLKFKKNCKSANSWVPSAIPNPQFLRCDNPKIGNTQIFMVNPKITNSQIFTKYCTTPSQNSHKSSL